MNPPAGRASKTQSDTVRCSDIMPKFSVNLTRRLFLRLGSCGETRESSTSLKRRYSGEGATD